jgi:hypothetical protein
MDTTRRRFRVAYSMLALLGAVAAAAALLLAMYWPGGSEACDTTIRTTRWTAVGAFRADRLAEGILVLGIRTHSFRLSGDGDRAVGISPRGSIAIRRAGEGFEVLGLTVVAEKGCVREAAERSRGRLEDFAAGR